MSAPPRLGLEDLAPAALAAAASIPLVPASETAALIAPGRDAARPATKSIGTPRDAHAPDPLMGAQLAPAALAAIGFLELSHLRSCPCVTDLVATS